MKSKVLKYGVISFVMIFCLGLVTTNVLAKLQKNKELDVKTVELKEGGDRLSLDLKYPEIRFKNKHVEQKINAQLKEQIYDFKKYIEDIYNEVLENTPKEIIENSYSFDYKGLSTFDYEIVDNVLSVRLNLVQFTGGAHPMTFVRDFNFDLTNGNVLKFKDLFNEEGKKTYKQTVDSIIRDIINKDPENYFEEEFKGIGDDVQYYLTSEGVVIFYQLYELAPYSAGIPEFKIPYGAFNGTININPKK